MFAGRKKVEKILEELYLTQREGLLGALNAIHYDDFQHVEYFAEMAGIFVRQSAETIGVSEYEMLLGSGPKQKVLAKLMDDLLARAQYALDARNRQPRDSVRWWIFEASAVVATLLWVVISARGAILNFKIERSHPIYAEYEKCTEVLSILFDLDCGKIKKNKAIEALGG